MTLKRCVQLAVLAALATFMVLDALVLYHLKAGYEKARS